MIEIGKLSLYVYGNRGAFVILYGLLEPFTFTDHRGKRWSVPCRDAGSEQFITDGASFPWWLRFVPGWFVLCALAVRLMCVGPVDIDALLCALGWFCALQSFVGYPIHLAYSEAAVAHDYLYFIDAGKLYADFAFLHILLARARTLNTVSRRSKAIRVFVFGYRMLRAYLMWSSVVIFGWLAYRRHRRMA